MDVPGGIKFQESATLAPGASTARRVLCEPTSSREPGCDAGGNLTVFNTPWCKAGLGICYDVRFPQLSLAQREAGVELLIYPSAFNMTTGADAF